MYTSCNRKCFIHRCYCILDGVRSLNIFNRRRRLHSNRLFVVVGASWREQNLRVNVNLSSSSSAAVNCNERAKAANVNSSNRRALKILGATAATGAEMREGLMIDV